MKTSPPFISMDDTSNKDKKIKSFLKALPHLELSETGLKNVCARFFSIPLYSDKTIYFDVF